MLQLENKNPYSKSEILASMDDINQKVKSFYKEISPELFFHDGLGGWSPAQNLSHLGDIAKGGVLLLRLPRFLFLIFGKRESQRDFRTLQTDYIGSDKSIYLGPLVPAPIPPKDYKIKSQSLMANGIRFCTESIEGGLISKAFQKRIREVDKYSPMSASKNTMGKCFL
ncbi:MAG: hypothetical protein IPQ05_11670 [Leptospiraceae bacterium]|nr:hypothetical protein [Leptospiraceae bacterium]